LENWVSERIEKPFQLYPVNSSKHMDCKIVLDDNFRERYEKIYDYYDFPKNKKTLI